MKSSYVIGHRAKNHTLFICQGHDDTLQLVLNVMVQAGKEAKRLRGLRRRMPRAGDVFDVCPRRVIDERRGEQAGLLVLGR